MPKVKSRWLIDEHKKLPELKSVTEAYNLWKTLTTERDYRMVLLKDDENPDHVCDSYDIIDDIAVAMSRMVAATGLEVSYKIHIALNVIKEGGAPNYFELSLLRSAAADAPSIEVASRLHKRRKAA